MTDAVFHLRSVLQKVQREREAQKVLAQAVTDRDTKPTRSMAEYGRKSANVRKARLALRAAKRLSTIAMKEAEAFLYPDTPAVNSNAEAA